MTAGKTDFLCICIDCHCHWMRSQAEPKCYMMTYPSVLRSPSVLRVSAAIPSEYMALSQTFSVTAHIDIYVYIFIFFVYVCMYIKIYIYIYIYVVAALFTYASVCHKMWNLIHSQILKRYQCIRLAKRMHQLMLDRGLQPTLKRELICKVRTGTYLQTSGETAK